MTNYYSYKTNDFNASRNQFLAALYTHNFLEAEKIYIEISKKIERKPDLSEVDLKAIHQIRHAFRIYRKEISTHCSHEISKKNAHIKKTLTTITRESIKNPVYVNYETWYEKLGLSDKQFGIMLKTVSTLQLTVGCNTFCKRCNEWALPGVRKHFNFSAVKRLSTEIFESGNNAFSFYSGSDPLDWRHKDKTMVDVMSFLHVHGYKPQYGLLTKMPLHSESIMISMVQTGVDLAVSVTDKNRSRIEKIENRMGTKLQKQHDVDELLIPAGLEDDFKSIKSSITDNYGTEITPEGAFLIIPTFTSPLNPTGQCRIPVSKNLPFFIPQKIGTEALPVEYFKPLKMINLNGEEVTPDVLLDAQIENIILDNGSEEITPPGMMNLEEYFKTFEPAAVKSRKKIFPAIFRELRQHVFMPGQVEDKAEGRVADEQLEKEFRMLLWKKLRQYLDFCHIDGVITFKKYTFSYYLKSISDYLVRHPVEKTIVRHLRIKDRELYEKKFRHISPKQASKIETTLEGTAPNTFDFFQFLLFKLLDNPENEVIGKFIDDHPAKFDSETGRFIRMGKQKGKTH